MDSDESTLASLQQNDYTTLVVVVAIGYDYFLTFPKEVEYVWDRPWTFVSTLFLFVRYFGLLAFMFLPLLGTSFLPGPASFATSDSLYLISCATIEIIGTWAVMVFILATDLVMILRIWAMYLRSRVILATLLVSYSVELIPSVIASIVYSNPNDGPMTVNHVQRFAYCTMGPVPPGWNRATSITQLIHATVMCTLVVVQFIRQSLEMYRVTKRWGLNQFMNLLVVEGVLYFLFIFAWNIVNTLYAWGINPAGWQIILVGIVEAVPLTTLAPRFVLSMRELYARNVRGGRRDDIDVGFGFSTISGDVKTASMMVFADSRPDEESFATA